MTTCLPLLIVLLGPTASGKTALSIALAQRFALEVISADSRQVYRQMDIGTAKPTMAQRAAVPHHLLDVCNPSDTYTVARYQKEATLAIADVHRRGWLPILVGGTGLYIRAVRQGYTLPEVPPEPDLRAACDHLLAEYGLEHTCQALWARLSDIAPTAAAHVDRHNPRRLVRALEVARAGGTLQTVPQSAPYRVLVLGVTQERATLYQRADARVVAMVESGLLDETRHILAAGYAPTLPALSGIGYREMIAHLRGTLSLSEAVAQTQYATHAYIRRQLIWFRREPDICWMAGTLDELVEQATAHLTPWLAAS